MSEHLKISADEKEKSYNPQKLGNDEEERPFCLLIL